jgi:hypothetical protein
MKITEIITEHLQKAYVVKDNTDNADIYNVIYNSYIKKLIYCRRYYFLLDISLKQMYENRDAGLIKIAHFLHLIELKYCYYSL